MSKESIKHFNEIVDQEIDQLRKTETQVKGKVVTAIINMVKEMGGNLEFNAQCPTIYNDNCLFSIQLDDEHGFVAYDEGCFKWKPDTLAFFEICDIYQSVVYEYEYEYE